MANVSGGSYGGCDFIINFDKYKESLNNCSFSPESVFTLKKAVAPEETKKDKNAAVSSTSLFLVCFQLFVSAVIDLCVTGFHCCLQTCGEWFIPTVETHEGNKTFVVLLDLILSAG